VGLLTLMGRAGRTSFAPPRARHLVAAALLAAGCATSPDVSRYPHKDCAAYLHARKEFTASINWCVRYTEVRNDAMEVRVSWEVVRLEGEVDTIFQLTDDGNLRMYLTDESGQRYDHVRVSGAALGTTHRLGSLREGSFFFPLRGRHSRNFLFHDDENGIALRIRR
jgi:hypothetical protein